MPTRKHSQGVKSRFIEAVEAMAALRYPDAVVVDIVRSLGIDTSGYYRLNRANNYPTLDYCIDLCNLYGISADWLFLGIGPMIKVEGQTMKPIELLKAGVEAVEKELKQLHTKRTKAL